MSFISEGTYSRIYNCEEGVVKIIDMDKFESFLREILIVRSLSHKNIIDFESVEFTDETVRIYMKKFDMTLERFIFERRPMSCNLVMSIAHEIVQGMAYMHARRIIHADLKPSNILMSGNSIVIIDFGISVIETGEPLTSRVQTITYRAPEINDKKMYNYYDSKIDIFSFGCILYELIAGKPLFRFAEGVDNYAKRTLYGKTHKQIYRMLYSRAKRPGADSIELLHIAAQCLSYHPKDRPSSRELLEQFNNMTHNIEHITLPESPTPKSYDMFMTSLCRLVIPKDEIQYQALEFIGAVLYSRYDVLEKLKRRDNFKDIRAVVINLLWEFEGEFFKKLGTQ